MNSITSILSLFFILVLALGGPSSPYAGRGAFYFSIVGPYSKTGFQCLVQYEHYVQQPVFIVRIYQNSRSTPGIDPHGIQTINNAVSAVPNAFIDVYMQICRNLDAKTQVDQAAEAIALSLSPYAWLYVKVQPSVNPACSWESFSHSENCAYLYQVVSQIQAKGLGCPIFTTAKLWKKYFGSTCDNFAIDNSACKLFYAKYNSDGQVDPTQSYADFEPFGGWTAPYYKQVGGNVTYTNLCGNPGFRARVDERWSPDA